MAGRAPTGGAGEPGSGQALASVASDVSTSGGGAAGEGTACRVPTSGRPVSSGDARWARPVVGVASSCASNSSGRTLGVGRGAASLAPAGVENKGAAGSSLAASGAAMEGATCRAVFWSLSMDGGVCSGAEGSSSRREMARRGGGGSDGTAVRSVGVIVAWASSPGLAASWAGRVTALAAGAAVLGAVGTSCGVGALSSRAASSPRRTSATRNGAAVGSGSSRTPAGGASDGVTGRARVNGGASSTERVTTGRASRNVAAGRTVGWMPPSARLAASWRARWIQVGTAGRLPVTAFGRVRAVIRSTKAWLRCPRVRSRSPAISLLHHRQALVR